MALMETIEVIIQLIIHQPQQMGLFGTHLMKFTAEPGLMIIFLWKITITVAIPPSNNGGDNGGGNGGENDDDDNPLCTHYHGFGLRSGQLLQLSLDY